jgi:hypothetical protein
MRPICMGPELALPAMYATTLSREAASFREETSAHIAHSGLADGANADGTRETGTAPAVFPSEVASTTGITPEEIA